MSAIFQIGVFLLLATLISCDNYVFETNDFQDPTIVPTISNGHLGFVAYSDSLHMNGLYNGATGNSHRARIPNYGRIQYALCGLFTQGDDCTFGLDMARGLFRTTSSYSSNQFSVELLTYAHRIYDKTIVNQLTIRRTTAGVGGSWTVPLFHGPGMDSVDLEILNEMQDSTPNGQTYTFYEYSTVEVEDPRYQPEKRRFFVISQDVPESVELPEGSNEITYTWLTSVGYIWLDTLNEYSYLQTQNNILQTHVNAWSEFWNSYNIVVEGDDELDKSIRCSLYFLGSALPAMNAPYTPRPPFYGLAPAGLGKGGAVGREYQGHSFWDTEIWMLPAVLLLEPQWSEELLHYRILGRQSAIDNAFETGYKGFRFPWESGYTGREVTPDCCPQNPMFQQHIIGDVAFAVKTHFLATHDVEWMRREGCELAYRTAEFWESRVTYNATTDRYDIIGIMGPDEDHFFETNNAYTNVVAAYNLFFGEFASCLCHSYYPDVYENKTTWARIARSIALNYDAAGDFIPQYEGFEPGNTIIKQADTVLLSYPLMYPMDASTQQNNLYIYGNATRDDGPAMTWAIHTIGHLDIGEVPDEALFHRSYVPYIRKPFYIWSETVEGHVGVGNFLTGAGGFLQLIMNGYGGIRFHDDHLMIRNATLPPRTTSMRFNGTI